MKTHSWKLPAFALATTGAVVYVSCALFDALFPPYGVIAWLAPASPWPLGGSLLGVLTGLAMFTLGGFVLGAVYGGAWGFWNGRLSGGGAVSQSKASRKAAYPRQPKEQPMKQSITRKLWAMGAVSFWLATTGAYAAELPYRQVVDGVAVYLGMMPAELVRGHPREHPEGEMHGGVPVGESHLTVAVFEAKTGRRIPDAEVTARITGDRGVNVQKRLELMVIAGSATYGNYFSMSGNGPYSIDVRIRLPGKAREVRAVFTWARA